MSSKQGCDICKWWKKYEDGHGSCHRNPPEVARGLGERINPRHGIWPITCPYGWCGGWAIRED